MSGARNGLFWTWSVPQGSLEHESAKLYQVLLSDRRISREDFTLELVIKIAKQGNVQRTRYASAAGLLKDRTR